MIEIIRMSTNGSETVETVNPVARSYHANDEGIYRVDAPLHIIREVITYDSWFRTKIKYVPVRPVPELVDLDELEEARITNRMSRKRHQPMVTNARFEKRASSALHKHNVGRKPMKHSRDTIRTAA